MKTRIPKVIYAAVSILFLFPFPGLSQEEKSVRPGRVRRRDVMKRDLMNFPSSLWGDTREIFTDPLNLGILGAATATSVTFWATPIDGNLADSVERNGRVFSKHLDISIGTAGSPATHAAAAAGLYAIGVALRNESIHGFSKDLINALVINGVVTMGLKLSTARVTPNDNKFAWPSGHTSSSACFAAVVDETYGHWVGVPCLALAGLVAFERIDTRSHWLSDVVMGYALGYVIGRTVASKKKIEVGGFALETYVSPFNGTPGLAFGKDF